MAVFICLISILLCNLVLFNFLLILWLLFALYHMSALVVWNKQMLLYYIVNTE